MSVDRLRLARDQLGTDPRAALSLVRAAWGDAQGDDASLAATVTLVLGALERAGMDLEVVELAKTAAGRWPRFVELRYREGRARRRLDHRVEMLAAFEACLAIGEDTSHPSTPGAGTYLPFFELGELAEKSGDLTTARAYYERAVGFERFEPAMSRLRALGSRRGMRVA